MIGRRDPGPLRAVTGAARRYPRSQVRVHRARAVGVGNDSLPDLRGVSRITWPYARRSPKGLDEAFPWSLLDAAPDTILVVDDGGRIVFAHEHGAELFGYPSAELLGLTVEDLLPAGPPRGPSGPPDPVPGRADGPIDGQRSRAAGPSGRRLRVAGRGQPEPAVDRRRHLHRRRGARHQRARPSRGPPAPGAAHPRRQRRRRVHLRRGDAALLVRERGRGAPHRLLPRRAGDDDAAAPQRHARTTSTTASSSRRSTSTRTRRSSARRCWCARTASRSRSRRPTSPPRPAATAPSGSSPSPATAPLGCTPRRRCGAARRRCATPQQVVAVAEDRHRIARDLHDTVIQRLFGAGLNLQATAANADDRDPRPPRDHDHRPRRDHQGAPLGDLLAAGPVRRRAGRVARPVPRRRRANREPGSGFEPRLRFDGPIETMDDAIADHLVPTLREALSNIARHAGAHQVRVTITVGTTVTLSVVDDGTGHPGAGPQRPGPDQHGRSGRRPRRNLPDRSRPGRRHEPRVGRSPPNRRLTDPTHPRERRNRVAT